MFELKLSKHEFWRLTPAQFFSLLDRMQFDLYRRDYRSGIVACVIANVNRDATKNPDPFKISEFMMSGDFFEEEEPIEELTPEEQGEMMLAKFMGIVGGLVNNVG